MTNWERYEKARNRKRFQGTVKATEPEYHESGICERLGCRNKATKSIYALGYLAGVCQEHYEDATSKERDNAVRFKYAER